MEMYFKHAKLPLTSSWNMINIRVVVVTSAEMPASLKGFGCNLTSDDQKRQLITEVY